MSESKVNEAISHGSSPEGEIEVLSPSQISQQPLSKANIHRNMILLVLMDTVWIFGVTEMGLASSPLYVYLKTSNTMIGLINATGILGLIGIFLSPFITIHFPIKKLYLLIVNIPYLLPWGLIGCALIFSRQMGLSNHFLLIFIVVMSAISGLSAGFVTLPHQEYIAACIPMSYRGRLSGYGGSLGSGLAIISNILAGWILLRLAKPEAYGYLYVMTWFFCQAGYILALFARERRSPVEKSPKPWSKTMIKVALCCDKPFMRVVALQAIYGLFISPIFFQFIAVYGFKDLKMAPASAAVIGVTQRIFSLFVCGYIGYLIDRWSPQNIFSLSSVDRCGCRRADPDLARSGDHLFNQFGMGAYPFLVPSRHYRRLRQPRLGANRWRWAVCFFQRADLRTAFSGKSGRSLYLPDFRSLYRGFPSVPFWSE